MADKPDAAFAGVPGLQQPPNFDFNDPSAWSTWIEQFEEEERPYFITISETMRAHPLEWLMAATAYSVVRVVIYA
ncbi:hypothetical protein HPB52_008314 [Rhipicephalus sanguineus]|uniref:Uncharacterized protein n=1 Tax=Rhipicephalus sanguineus TaxID=34632 RepID=A0A9D4PQD5_RHISA|nr:hypothetical protein HPB52_008314 [Rhipicephalus sanguineus]